MKITQPPLNIPMYSKKGFLSHMWRYFFQSIYDTSTFGFLAAKTADPLNPARGEAILWLSDGTDSGSDGDIMVSITDTNGTTKTTTLVDFSAL